MNKVVLVVEDEPDWHIRWNLELGSKVVLLCVLSIETAKEVFATHRDYIDAIVMDACVPGEFPTTPPLVREFRKTFKGPIIAVSSLEYYRGMLLRAGCDHVSSKGALPQKLLQVLGL